MSYVYLAKEKRRLKFSESILDTLNGQWETSASIHQEGDNVVIDSEHGTAVSLHIRRSRCCPFSEQTRLLFDKLNNPVIFPPDNPRRKYIPVAAACLLESPNADSILLTQRPLHMRSYPGLWVPPGGHCDSAEPIAITAIRELSEELGFHDWYADQSGSDNLHQSDQATTNTTTRHQLIQGLTPLCAWEAAYPNSACPTSHNLVIYYLLTWPETLNLSDHQSPNAAPPMPHLHLQREEVSGAVWLPVPVLQSLVENWCNFDRLIQEFIDQPTDTWTVDRDNNQSQSGSLTMDTLVWYWSIDICQWQQVPAKQLISSMTTSTGWSAFHAFVRDKPPTPTVPKRHISSGTLFAIKQWLSVRHNITF